MTTPGEDTPTTANLVTRDDAKDLLPHFFSRLRHSLRKLPLVILLVGALPVLGCQHTSNRTTRVEAAAPAITTISLGPQTLHTSVQRFGINLSGQTFYDSGQMLRNFAYRNPGFEGETWQSILRCKSVTATTCTDENQYAVWPAGFLNGARFDILSGSARGASGTIQSSSAVAPPQGITLTFTSPVPQLDAASFIRVRIDKRGDAQAGWWTDTKAGAILSTEYHDLSPLSPGKQALRVDASSHEASATVKAIFDSYNGRSFLQLRGRYTVAFRAKALSMPAGLNLSVTRLDTTRGNHTFLTQTVPLTSAWRNYSFDFTAGEDGRALGPVALSFEFTHAAALLDDATLTEAAALSNHTAFRNSVVQTLSDLHPGVLRYMDNGTNFGSSLDDLLAPPLARRRTGASTQQTLQEDCSIGLHEFLVLAEAVGADPWFSMPPGTSPSEAAALIEYLAGSTSTAYGARRAALGHPAPWTSAFHTIHLELGNEQWNARSFAGSTIQDPKAYGERAGEIFAAARASAAFQTTSFDLILGSWATVPWWTLNELASSATHDSVAVAPYLFSEFNDASSTEATFGPMFAQPEQIESTYMAEQVRTAAAATHPAKVAIYEVNLSTASGSVSQADIDRAVPSLGAGLAVADHMLLMLRDLGITTQCLFSLPEYFNAFQSPGPQKTTPLWGAVVDMGGPTSLRRPQFLATQLANSAILPTMLQTHITGPPHLWNQTLSSNDKIQLNGAHLLQTFAFADGPHRSLILLNLSRTDSIPVQFAGPSAPTGLVQESRLTSAHITDSNESTQQVRTTHTPLRNFIPTAPYTLPPFSMTTLTWN